MKEIEAGTKWVTIHRYNIFSVSKIDEKKTTYIRTYTRSYGRRNVIAANDLFLSDWK